MGTSDVRQTFYDVTPEITTTVSLSRRSCVTLLKRAGKGWERRRERKNKRKKEDENMKVGRKMETAEVKGGRNSREKTKASSQMISSAHTWSTSLYAHVVLTTKGKNIWPWKASCGHQHKGASGLSSFTALRTSTALDEKRWDSEAGETTLFPGVLPQALPSSSVDDKAIK